MSARRRKYARGSPVDDLHQFIRHLQKGGYGWLNDRPCHPSWLLSMQARTLVNLIDKGRIRWANTLIYQEKDEAA